jgi:3'(2'), 5'-bisphosphate nucleotidase
MSNLSRELAVAVEAARRAGARLLAHYARGAIAVETKADQSPVTAADEAAEAVILDGLTRALPGIAVVSEESAGAGASPKLGRSFILVDPLDGTRELVAGRDEFTVNLAIVTDGKPVLGIGAAPAMGLVWRGVVTRVAERLQLTPGAPLGAASEQTPIHTRSASVGGVRVLVSRSHLDRETEAFLVRLPGAERLAIGSSLKFCKLAEGAADIYPRLGPTSEWDIAAGHAVLVAAGGSVRMPDGRPLAYGVGPIGFRVPAFIAVGEPSMLARVVGSRIG